MMDDRGPDEILVEEATEIAETIINGNLTHGVERWLDPERDPAELALLSIDIMNQLINIRVLPAWQVADQLSTLIRTHQRRT